MSIERLQLDDAFYRNGVRIQIRREFRLGAIRGVTDVEPGQCYVCLQSPILNDCTRRRQAILHAAGKVIER